MKQQEIYKPSKKRTLEEGVRFGKRCCDYYALPAPRHPNVFIRTFTHTPSSEPHCRSRGGPTQAQSRLRHLVIAACNGTLRSVRRVTPWNGGRPE
jgi:hypothetical protein